MNQGNHEQSTAWRQCKALLGIEESAKSYAMLYNHYVRVDRWDKACYMKQVIKSLAYAVPFVEEALQLNVIFDSDGEIIKEINISCGDDVMGLSLKVY